MKCVIEICMDNEAFTDNQGNECARILRRMADKIDGTEDIYGFTMAAMDSNGNRVGTMEVTDN